MSNTSHPSPFIEGTTLQYAWDSTSLTSFLSCPRRYQYTLIQGMRPKNPNFAIALVFGILMHKGVEIYAAELLKLKNHDDAVLSTLRQITSREDYATLPVESDIDQMKEEYDPEEDDGITLRNSRVRTRYYLIRALCYYFEQYRDDPLKTVVLATGKPAVELSFRTPLGIEIGGQELILSGHIDRLVTFNGDVWASDVKTTKAISQQFFQGFDLSHQMTGYTLGGTLALAQPVKGVQIDAVALLVGGVKLGRAPTTRSKGQIREYIELLKHVAEQAEIFYERQYYPMNTASCYFCDFKPLCRIAPEARSFYEKQLFVHGKAWNPLESR